MSKIIFLNGMGSAGKTSIAQSIQKISNSPWLRIGGDNFIDMMPEQYYGRGEKAKEGYYYYLETQNKNGPMIEIKGSNLGKKVFNLVPEIIKLLADNNNDLIIDEVILRNDALKDYIRSLNQHTVYFIKVFCELKIALEREAARGDRDLGLSNGQYRQVYNNEFIYDLEVDTSNKNSNIIAHDILNYIQTTPSPQAFVKTANIIDINFIPLTEADFPFLLKWLENIHVKMWWDKDIAWNENLIKDKYSHYVQGYKKLTIQGKSVLKPIYAYIICINKVKIGYIQYYDKQDISSAQGYDVSSLPSKCAALDWYIGEIDYLGKGYGVKILNKFIEEFIFKEFAYVSVDPESKNTRAVKVYLKAGFKVSNIIEGDNITLMLKEKTLQKQMNK